MDHNSHTNPFIHLLRSAFQAQGAGGRDNTAAANDNEPIVSDSTSGVNARPSADAQMDGGEYDDIPSLWEVSDSSSEGGHESDRDTNEVAMQAIEPSHGNGVTGDSTSTDSQGIRPAYVSQSSSNRRPRVHEDDDEERDRRHPSQRVSSASNDAASSSSAAPTSTFSPLNQPHTHTTVPTPGIPSTPQPPSNNNIQRHIFRTTINLGNGGNANNPFRLFQHILPNNHPNTLNNTTSNNPVDIPIPENQADNLGTQAHQAQPPVSPPPPTLPQDGHNGRRAQSLFGGMLSFELGNGGVLIPLPGGGAFPPTPAAADNDPDNQTPNAAQQHEHLPPHLADFLARFGAQVANGTLNGLGFGLESQQEDPDRARKLVNGLEVVPEGLVRRLERVGGSGGGMGEEPTKGGDSGCAICWDRLLDTDGAGFGSLETQDNPEDMSKLSSSTQPKIVSLPCAHVFHAECLIPWFSRPRQTTCPTCRFNIDPDNLTYVSWQHRQRERREAGVTATGDAEGTNDAGVPREDTLPADEAPAPGPAPAHSAAANPNDHASAAAREQLLRRLANFYTETLIRPPPAQQQQQTQGDAPAPGAPQMPGITVTSIPITIPVPVAFPVGGLNARQTTPTGTVPNASVGPSRPATSGDVPQPAQRGHQPRPQSGPDMAGEYARLFARLGRPSHVPVPLDPISPQSNVNIGIPRNGQPNVPFSRASDSATSSGGTPSGQQGHGFPFHPGLLHGLGTATPFGHRGTTNATPGAPTNPQYTPQPTNTNTFHLPGLDFGIPGMRADVVVTMDMIFDPRGPVGTEHRDDNAPAGEPHPHEGVTMEEDIMMMMPDDHEGGNAGDEMTGFGEEMLRMFAGMPHNVGNNNNATPPQQPQQDQVPPAANAQQPQQPGLTNLGNDIHFAAGSGRNIGEAFAQLLARMSGGAPNVQNNAGGHAPAQPPHVDPAQQQAQPGNEAADGQPQPQAQPGALPFAAGGLFDGLFGGGFGNGFPGFGPRPRRYEGPKPAWSLPPAPGLTLRQRVERREREAGLRCYDVSCGLGPSDEDPFTDKISEVVSSMKQLVIREKNESGADVCEHRFHSACLVSAERVALRGADAVVENGRVDVSCPVCRNVGCVTKEEWDEGVVALES